MNDQESVDGAASSRTAAAPCGAAVQPDATPSINPGPVS